MAAIIGTGLEELMGHNPSLKTICLNAIVPTGNEQLVSIGKSHVESFAHLNDLLSNGGELAARLIRLISECIRYGVMKHCRMVLSMP